MLLDGLLGGKKIPESVQPLLGRTLFVVEDPHSNLPQKAYRFNDETIDECLVTEKGPLVSRTGEIPLDQIAEVLAVTEEDVPLLQNQLNGDSDFRDYISTVRRQNEDPGNHLVFVYNRKGRRQHADVHFKIAGEIVDPNNYPIPQTIRPLIGIVVGVVDSDGTRLTYKFEPNGLKCEVEGSRGNGNPVRYSTYKGVCAISKDDVATVERNGNIMGITPTALEQGNHLVIMQPRGNNRSGKPTYIAGRIDSVRNYKAPPKPATKTSGDCVTETGHMQSYLTFLNTLLDSNQPLGSAEFTNPFITQAIAAGAITYPRARDGDGIPSAPYARYASDEVREGFRAALTTEEARPLTASVRDVKYCSKAVEYLRALAVADQGESIAIWGNPILKGLKTDGVLETYLDDADSTRKVRYVSDEVRTKIADVLVNESGLNGLWARKADLSLPQKLIYSMQLLASALTATDPGVAEARRKQHGYFSFKLVQQIHS